MNEICNSFLNIIKIKPNEVIYLYSGKNINTNLKFNEIANSIDKEGKRMSIILNEMIEKK